MIIILKQIFYKRHTVAEQVGVVIGAVKCFENEHENVDRRRKWRLLVIVEHNLGAQTTPVFVSFICSRHQIIKKNWQVVRLLITQRFC